MSEILAAYAQRLKEHPPERPTCKTCPYWNREWDDDIAANRLDPEFLPDSDEQVRECRRGAPRRSNLDKYLGSGRDDQIDELLKRGYGEQGNWLYTRADDWCGEHPDFTDYLRELKDAKAYV